MLKLYYSDTYEIKFISENIKLKKNEIITSLKYNSFKKLAETFLTNSDFKKFNKKISLDFINKFLFSMDINEEKINNNNYSSKVQLAYDNMKLVEYFITNNINFVPYEPEKYLIIIFNQEILSEKILSKENNFYEYLNLHNKDYDLFFVPNLDINDRFIITKEDFISKHIKNISQLKNKYKYENILLVHAKSNSDITKIRSYVYKNDQFNIFDKFSIEKINYETFFDQLEENLLEYWKKQNLVNPSIINNTECRIKTLNLLELKKIKEILNNNKY